MKADPTVSGKAALVVIDVQNEFANDPRLANDLPAFLSSLETLLGTFRKDGHPVLHVHYITEADGSGYLPHHKAQNRPRCLRGTHEAEPHPAARPNSNESVFAKQAYSAFSSKRFKEFLQDQSINALVLCGLHTHVCVRQTAIDALAEGYSVFIVKDAIASYDVLHAQISESFLKEHGVRFCGSQTIWKELQNTKEQKLPSLPVGQIHPVAQVEGSWIDHSKEQLVELRNPSAWDEVLGHVPLAEMSTISSAVSAANEAQRTWKQVSLRERLALLTRWTSILTDKQEEILPLMVQEIGKPISACRIEWQLLSDSLELLQANLTEDAMIRSCVDTEEQEAMARRCPHGVVAIISPWNNPVFLPASKIAAAIAMGNGVVWKPALPCARTSIALQNSFIEAGFPVGLVNLLFGRADTASRLIKLPGIHAVTLTGSVETGRDVAATCGALLKPLQAELGGNNAAIVTKHCDLAKTADQIAGSAFGYAGQACTATRRVIVESSVNDRFLDELKRAVSNLLIGNPTDESTVIGPVISKHKQESVLQQLECLDAEAKVIAFTLPKNLNPQGCWLTPTIIHGLDEFSPLVQQESFAPILIVQEAKDIDHGIELCNGVSYGLISALFSDNPDEIEKFKSATESGIVQLNLPTRTLHMQSPFSGWKASGVGPPEHGVWDLDFYTRWQAVNRKK